MREEYRDHDNDLVRFGIGMNDYNDGSEMYIEVIRWKDNGMSSCSFGTE